MSRNSALILEFFQENALDIAGCAHIALDAVKANAVGKGRPKPARILSQTLSPGMKELGVDTTWTYMDCRADRAAESDLLVHPIPTGDSTFRTTRFSAFAETNLHEKLQGASKKTLIISGYFSDLAGLETALDARKLGYNVIFAHDASSCTALGNAQDIGDRLQESGAINAKAKNILKACSQLPALTVA